MAMSMQEKQAIMMQTIDVMKVYTIQNICALYHVIDAQSGMLHGSGTYINLHGQPYILTAGHVAYDAMKHQGLAHSTSYGVPPRWVTNPYQILSSPSDLALVRLEPNALDQTTKSALGSGHLAQTSAEVENDLLFLHGFPGAKSKPIKLLGGVFSTSYSYGAFEGVSKKYDWFDPKLHIALEFSPEGMIDDQGRKADFVDPHGLSGSALWKTNRTKYSGKDWSPDKAQIVGVVIVWDDKFRSLIATRIEVVRLFLLKSIRDEYAYFRWLQRGKPDNDEWNDWFAAVDAIRDV